ncbi:DUF896 domain-containing protein [Jeotgalibaca ciconiae]|uniref:UPF0291 protein EJN90_07790 n=1 Tax=Jeotgalibaca ciconiae TaxID=2496265 RepID=A0A3S9HBL6_9LACT|nr:DUF896 domain-containing protein [Jeotgalibaca ciconiae]AZP04543.1 DUF896 domain-containing protein [Jeotgalibaca ciconiae]HJB23071.1 DUF896 domain-containing protein [Candidatus Jeotgalibaca pullicola]
MDKTLARINELARKAKTAEGLTTEEKTEQKELREKYIKNFRSSLNEVLLNSTVYDPEGTDVTPEKLKQAQRDMHLKNAQELLKEKNIVFLDADDKKM